MTQNAIQTPAENEALLRFQAVSQLVGLERTMIYRLVRKGQFPAPLRISHRCARWPASSVQKWIAEQVAKAQQPAVVEQ